MTSDGNLALQLSGEQIIILSVVVEYSFYMGMKFMLDLPHEVQDFWVRRGWMRESEEI